MSVAAPLWFWKFWKKILNLGIFFQNFEKIENFQNFESKFQKSEANFDAERGIYEEKTKEYVSNVSKDEIHQ